MSQTVECEDNLAGSSPPLCSRRRWEQIFSFLVSARTWNQHVECQCCSWASWNWGYFGGNSWKGFFTCRQPLHPAHPNCHHTPGKVLLKQILQVKTDDYWGGDQLKFQRGRHILTQKGDSMCMKFSYSILKEINLHTGFPSKNTFPSATEPPSSAGPPLSSIWPACKDDTTTSKRKNLLLLQEASVRGSSRAGLQHCSTSRPLRSSCPRSQSLRPGKEVEEWH